MWLAVVPTAVIVLLAIVLLGPPLGDLLLGSGQLELWPRFRELVRPEPTEQARYLIALTAPLLLTAIAVWLARDRIRVAAITRRRLVLATQWAVVAFLAACLVLQRLHTFPAEENGLTPSTVAYFSPATLVAAAALSVAAVLAATSPRAARLRDRLAHESPTRAWCGIAIAVVMVGLSVLPAINSDATIGNAESGTIYHLAFTADEAFAVLDGRSPLGDFIAQYGSLWPYLTAAGMSLLGSSLTAFTLLMAAITAASLLAAFGIARRLTPTTSAALLLFLPLLATSLFVMRQPLDNRYSPVNWFGGFPLRLAGPFLLAWLVVRHLSGARPRPQWALFLAAGLVALNNVDFGVPALGATLAALLWTMGPLRAAALRRLALQALLGLGAAFALVSVLLLIRTGSLPDIALLFRYARLFAVAGYQMLPLEPVIGLSTVIFATYVVAIGAASVRTLRADQDRALTGLLVWSGVFGLGTGSYYLGRSHPELLISMFAGWALALMPLTLLAVRRLARRPPWAEALPELACVFGFALMACSLAQTPTPWEQTRRLGEVAERTLYSMPSKPFVAAQTEPGEHVALLMVVGHRVGAALDVTDVTPLTGIESIFSEAQLEDVLKLLREEGGSKVFLDEGRAPPEASEGLARRGYRRVARDPAGLVLWVAP